MLAGVGAIKFAVPGTKVSTGTKVLLMLLFAGLFIGEVVGEVVFILQVLGCWSGKVSGKQFQYVL